jgi:HSP20 family molecular chaperone IbpA
MVEYSDDDEVFKDINSFYKRLMERMLKDVRDFEASIESGQLKGTWDVQPVNKPGVRGYVARGQFHTGNHPLLTSENNLREESREPLTDVFDEKDHVKVYMELPGVEKSDIQLNVTDNAMEIKAGDFANAVKLPPVDVDSEKASASYRNGVLEVTVPKIQKTVDEGKKRTIKID